MEDKDMINVKRSAEFAGVSETEKEEPARAATLYDLLVVKDVLRQWRHLRRTYKDGLEINDDSTRVTVIRSLVERCRAGRLEPVECRLNCSDSGNITMEMDVKIHGKVHTIDGQHI